VVEKIAEMKADVKNSRRMVLVGVAVSVLFCMMTFGMCVLAMERSKEFVVVNSVLVDSVANQPVATRKHEAIIDDPLNSKSAAGVEFISMYYADGSMARYQVNGFTKAACKSEDKQCVDGHKYVFHTPQGDFVGHPTMDKNGSPYLTFSPDTEGVVKRSLLATPDDDYSGDYDDYNTKSKSLKSFATGSPFTPKVTSEVTHLVNTIAHQVVNTMQQSDQPYK